MCLMPTAEKLSASNAKHLVDRQRRQRILRNPSEMAASVLDEV
jgi:hypothetical protein